MVSRLTGAFVALAVLAVLGATIVAGSSTATTTALSISTQTATLGQPVTLTADVTPSTATGAVTFYDGVTMLGTATLNSGQAALTTTLLPAGVDGLWARYGGDAQNTPSVAPTQTITVAAAPSYGFATPLSTSAVASAGLAVADFNGDGYPDVAALSQAGASTPGQLQILLGGPNGSLTVAWTTQIANPGELAVGDINGDGHPDIVFTNGQTVTVLFGNGDGTFLLPPVFAVNAQPTALAVVDLNGDGLDDIAVTSADNTLTVVLGGSGAGGTLQSLTAVPTPAAPHAISAADLNGDGHADLIVGTDSGTIGIFAGNGDGTFAAPTTAATVPNAGIRALAIADFNADGHLDVATANATDGSVTVLAGDGAGGLGSAVRYAVTTPVSIAATDVNGDGALDLVTVSGTLARIDVMLGAGVGFAAPLHEGSGVTPSVVAATELNGDGRADLVLGSASGDPLSVLFGSAFGVTAAPDPSSDGQPVTFTATTAPDATGAVTFVDGATTLGTVALSSGTAVLTTSALAAGARTIQAQYAGDATHPAATASVSVEVRGVVEVAIASSKSPSDPFDHVSLLATVRGEADSNQTPTGTVTFTDTNAGGSETTTLPLVNGVARWDRPRLYPGTHTVTARYDGDAAFAPLTSHALTQTVTSVVQCAFAATPNPALSGTTVTVATTCVDSSSPPVVVVDLAQFGPELTGSWSELGDGFSRQISSSSSFPVGTHTLTALPGPSVPYSFIIEPPLTSLTLRVVTNNADSGPGTLRQAVADANAGDTIIFAGPTLIAMNAPIEITKPLTIDGPGADNPSSVLELDGQGRTRLFVIRSGGVVIRGLTLVGGRNAGGDGGTGFAGGGGGAGMGGAIFVTAPGGTVLLDRDTFIHNLVIGGAGGNSLLLDSNSANAYGSGGGGGMDGNPGGTGTSSQPGAGGAPGIVDGSGGSGAWGTGGGQPGAFGGGAGGGFIATTSDTDPYGLGGGGGGALSPLGSNNYLQGASGGGAGGTVRITENCLIGLKNDVCTTSLGTDYIGGAGGGGAGLGGAIFAKDGEVDITNSSFQENMAIGGAAGVPAPPNSDNWIDSYGGPPTAGQGRGGAVFGAPGAYVGVGLGNTFSGDVFDTADADGSIQPGFGAALYLTSPREQTAQVGRTFANRISIRAAFSDGSPIPSEPITIQIAGAHFSDGTQVASLVADANGTVTSLPVIAGLVPGQYLGLATSDRGNTEFVLDVLAGGTTSIDIQAPGGEQSVYGDTSSVVATVTRTPSGVMGGRVEFLDGARVLGSAPLVNSTATFSIGQLPAGYHTLTAIYTGDAATVGSASDGLWHVVTSLPSQTFRAASNAALGAQQFVTGSFTSHSIQAAAIVDGGISVADVPLGQTVHTYPTAQQPTALAAGDFNGDGYTDVAVSLPGSVQVWLGGANGLTAGGSISVPTGAAVATGDFNQDGYLDIALVEPSTTVQTWFGKGDGTFAAGPASVVSFGANIFGTVVGVGDFDLDGTADLAIVDSSRTNLLLLGGDGAGSFSALAQATSSLAVDGLTVRDFDGDGWPDIALVRDDGSSAALFGPFDATTGAAYAGSTPPTGATGASIASIDLDGDGFDDLIAADRTLVRVYYSHGDGTFSDPLALANANPIQVAVGEFTGDSRADVAVLAADGSLAIAAGGPGTPSVTWRQPNAIASGTALGTDQLNATANEGGTFAYTPAAGAVLPDGLQTLSVTFVPRDPAQPHVTTTTQIWVQTPVITWTPAPLVWPQTSGPGQAQFNATSDVPGTFTYRWVDDLNNAPPYFTGNPFTLYAHFVPNDLLQWPVTDVTRSITLLKADPVITWNPAPIPFGQPIGAAQLNATATGVDGSTLQGSFIYEPLSGTVPPHSGPFPEQLLFSPSDAPDYNTATITKNIDVQFVPTTITSQPASTIGCIGQTAQFNVAATATSLVYRWRMNGQPLVDSGSAAGSLTSTLTLNIAPVIGFLDPSLTYQLDVLVNETLSQPATLTIEQQPALTIQGTYNPQVGQDLILTGADSSLGQRAATYQWQYSTDGVTWTNLSGQTALTLDIPSATIANNGYYRVTGSNACGANASLPFQVAMTKLSQSIGATILPAVIHYGDTVSFIGTDTSGLPLTYQAAGGFIEIVNGQLHATGIGSFQVYVTQPGNDVWAPAQPYLYQGTIEPAPLVAHLQPARRTYGSPNPAPTFTYTGLVNGDTPAVISPVPGDAPTITYPTISSDVGQQTMSLSGALSNPKYDIAFDPATPQMEIDPAPLTIHVNDATKVYGQDTPAFTFYYEGLVLGETQPLYGGPPQFSFVQQTPMGTGRYLGAGTYTITASQTDMDYTITAVPGTLTVLQASLSVTADNQTRPYGTANPTFTATAVGLQNNDSLFGIGLTFVTTATDQSPVGTYAITMEGQAANYAITFVPGTLTITPSSLTISTGFTTKAYGAPLPSFANFVQIAGTHSDTETAAVRAALTFTTGATPSSDVGSYVVTANLVSSNYTTTITPGGLTITRVPLTVSVANATRTYGATNPAFQASFAGFVLNQDPSVLGGTLTFGAPDANAGVGTYSITPGGLTSPDYTIAYVPGTLTITPATLTIAANNATRHYGYPTTLTASYTGLVGSDTPSNAGAVLTTTAVDASTPGAYPITVSGGPTANYTITYVNGTLTIDPAPLNVQPKDVTRNYGAPDPAFTVSYSGFVLGQDAASLSGTVQVTSTADLHSSVGTYALNASGLSSSNYSINYIPGRLNIFPIQLTVSGPFVTKTYGAPVPQFTADELTYSGFILGDGPSVLSGSFNFLTDATQTMPAGQFTSVFPDASNVKATNYFIVSTGGKLTVTKAPLTVQASSVAINYGQTPSFSATYSGFVLGETPAVLSGTLQFSPSASTRFAAGSYSITPGGLSSSNYSFQYLPGTLTVNAVPVTVTVADNETTYGQPIPGFSVTYSGLQNGDDGSAFGGTLAFSTPAAQGSPVGSYPVTASGLTSSNYTIQYAPGTLTITPAPLTVTAVRSQPRLYGTPNPAFSVTYSGFVLNDGPQSLAGALTFSAPTITTSPGTYPVTPGGLSSSNYAIAYVPGSIQIVAAPLTVTVNNATKTFGQPNPAFTLSYHGFENGEDPSVLSGTPVFQTSANDTTAPGISLVTVSGLSSQNYTIDFVAGQLTIAPANLVVSVAPASRPYGSINPDGYSYTLTYSGLVPGYDVTTNYPVVLWTTSATPTSPVGQYPVTLVNSSLSSPYYNITYAPGTLAVTPAPLTVTALSLSPAYGTSLPSPYPVFYNGLQNGESPSVLGGSLTFTTSWTTTSPVGTYSITPSGLTAQNYAITFLPGTITVRQASSTLTFGTRPPNPVYPAPPSAYETYPQANVPGTFTFNPSLDAPLAPGCYTVSATFTPTDSVDYTGASTTFLLCVNLGAQHITWQTPSSPLTYPQALDASVLNATVSGDGGQATGAVTYSPAAGAVLDAGAQTLHVFVAATPYYAATSGTITVTVLKGTQTITWPTPPAPLRFDQHFTSAQFTAVVNGSGPAAPGYISYYPSFLPSGVGLQTLTATASATNDYNQATSSIQVMVTPAPATCESDNGYGEGLLGEGDVTPLYCVTETSYNSPSGVGETEPTSFPAGVYLPQFTYANPNTAAEYILSTTDLFYVDNPNPSINSMSQTSAVKGSGPITIDIQGSGFVPSCGNQCPPVQCPQCYVDTAGTTVQWNGAAVPFTFVSPTEITVDVSAAMLATSGVSYITISNYNSWGQSQAVKELFITDAATTVQSSATSIGWDPSVAIPSDAEQPDLAASTDDGAGTLTTALYASNPASGFMTGSSFFDVFAEPDPLNPFSQVTIMACGGNPGPTDRVLWYDGAQWRVASNQTYVAGPPSCIQVVVNSLTTPSLSQLDGTYFVIAKDPPPVITSVTPSLQQIWPPDNKMVPISITVGVTDLVTPHPTCQIVSVSSNEPGTGEWQITGPLTLALQASRSGAGSGRVYTIGVTCTNEIGLSSPVSTTTVTVPHDQRK